MAKFLMSELVAEARFETARLGTGTGSANFYTDKEVGKFVKLVGDSRYALCAAGDPIEGRIASINTASLDNYSVGSVQRNSRMEVQADGLQATPGTGTIAVGDYVVCGTVVAKDTALGTALAKVTKATVQQGATPADLTAAGTMIKQAMHGWRVVSLGSVGTGAVGTTIVIERVGA